MADKKLPSKIDMAKNVIKSAAKNVKSVIDGNELRVNNLVFSVRMEICYGCDMFIEDGERCSECGCFLSVKVSLFAEECPIGMWPPVIPDEIEE